MEFVRVSTESDEYVSLRQEASILFTQSRQILYITTAFVVVALGWYAALAPPHAIPLWIFTLFLYGMLWISAVAYIINTNQAYRIGGYLAVFWESSDPDTHLAWHRMNRLGPAGGFLPNAATVIYAASTLMILSFCVIGRLTHFGESLEPIRIPVVVGILQIAISLLLSRYLRYWRDNYELVWRQIKESPAEMLRVHGRYEVVPSRIIAP